MVGKRLGPKWIDLETRGLNGVDARHGVERVLADAKRNYGAAEQGGENELASSGHFFAPVEGQSAPWLAFVTAAIPL